MSDADDTQAKRTMLRKTASDLQTAANLKISKRFFEDITGVPNTFYCNIDSEVLLRLITKGGGLLVDEASKASYVLSEDPSIEDGELPIRFIVDCVIKNKLLDKKTYISSKKFPKCRPQKRLYNCENNLQNVSSRNEKENTDNPSGSLADEPEVLPSTSNNRKEDIVSTDVDSLSQTSTNRSKKVDINNDKAMDWFFDQTGVEINTQSVSPDRKRKKYTLDEDLAIIRHLIRNKIYASTGGNRVWRTMEHQRVTTHTWGSMKARLKKVILVNMNSYGIPAAWKAQLTGNQTKKWRDNPEPVAEKRKSKDKTHFVSPLKNVTKDGASHSRNVIGVEASPPAEKRKSKDKTHFVSPLKNVTKHGASHSRSATEVEASSSGISKDCRNAKKRNINSSNNGVFDFNAEDNDDYVERVNSSFTKFLSSCPSPSPKKKRKGSDDDVKSERRRIVSVKTKISSSKSTSIPISPSPNKSAFITKTLGHNSVVVSHNSDSDLTKAKRNLSFIEDDDTIEEYESPPLQNSKSCDRLSLTRDSVEREISRKAAKQIMHDIVSIEFITAEVGEKEKERVGEKENARVGDSNAKETNVDQTAQSSLEFGSLEPIQVPARKKQRSIKTDLIQKRKKKPNGEEASSVEFDESDSSFSLSTVYEFLPQTNYCSKKTNNTCDSESEENADPTPKPHSHQTRRNETNREAKNKKCAKGKVNMPFSLQFKVSFLMDNYDLSLEEAMYLLERKGCDLDKASQWFYDSSSDED